MAIRKAPSFVQAQLGQPLPLLYGPGRVLGATLYNRELPNKYTVGISLLGEDEWDGIDRLYVNGAIVDHTDTSRFHFHPGIDGTLGAGLAPTSIGGDQGVDSFFSDLPGLQPVTFSRICYLAYKIPPDPGSPTAQTIVEGDYRGLKVRQFDNAGTQTARAYSTNTSWCIMDLIIRMWVLRESLVAAALAAAEKARFDFVSWKDNADRNDGLLADGVTKRFSCGIPLPNQVTMTQAIEQMLMVSQSFLIEDGGILYLRSDKPRAYSFLLTSDHVEKFSPPVNKQYMKSAANRLIGSFNDVNVPKMIGIFQCQRSGGTLFITTGPGSGAADHPFFVGDSIRIQKYAPDATVNDYLKVATVPTSSTLTCVQAGANTAVLGAGGEIGMDESRFTVRSAQVDHEAHQQAVGQRGVGLAIMHRARPQTYQFGNCSLDQVKRVLTFIKNRALGIDTLPYQGPWEVVVQAFYESVDAANNILCAQQCGDVIRIDRTISEEFQGDYELMERTIMWPRGGQDAKPLLELRMLQYLDTAFSDTQFTSQVIGVVHPPAGIAPISVIDSSGNNVLDLAGNTLTNRLPVSRHSYSSPNNLQNDATVDSIDAGGGVDTVRAYKAGSSTSTAWDRWEGSSIAESPPALAITGVAQGVVRYVLWDGSVGHAVSAFTDSLNDGWRWAGKLTTVNAGGGGGSSGGGGTGGNGTGGRGQLP
jgi:hypothetical protein